MRVRTFPSKTAILWTPEKKNFTASLKKVPQNREDGSISKGKKKVEAVVY